jgi:hypothetical protein
MNQIEILEQLSDETNHLNSSVAIVTTTVIGIGKHIDMKEAADVLGHMTDKINLLLKKLKES